MTLCPKCGRSVHGSWCESCASPVGTDGNSEKNWRGVEEAWRQVERSEGPSRAYSAEDFLETWRRMLLSARVAAGCVGGLVVAAISGLVSAFALPSTLITTATIAWVLGVGAAVATVATFVYWHVFLYKMWDQAQAITDRSTPGRAVGFLFIPFFNFYWQFVAYLHLARAMNTRLASGGAPRKLRIADGLVIAACMLTILSFLMNVFAWIPALAFGICSCMLAVQYKDAAVAIAREQTSVPY